MYEVLRVLHCPHDVGGQPQCLARMERALGLRSLSLTLAPSAFQYESDEILFAPGDGALTKERKRWRLLYRAAREFDVIHYNFGQPIIAPVTEPLRFWPPRLALRTWLLQPSRNLLAFADLALLKRAGKTIFVTYQGDDARQGDYCREHYHITFANEVEAGYYTAASDALKRHMIRRFDRHADRIYATNPDLLNVLPSRARFLPYANIDLTEWQPAFAPPRKRPLVLHAPSHRRVKGTRFLLDAAERLQREGVAFDLELVEGLPHGEASRRYAAADLVVDQLLAGWYGGLAVEAMALGKPVIAYIRPADLKFLPRTMCDELPVISAEPANIYEVLKNWLTERRSDLVAQGRAARAFVERWHDSRHIARYLVSEYRAARAGVDSADLTPAGCC